MIKNDEKKKFLSSNGGGNLRILLNPYQKHHEYIIFFLSNSLDFEQPNNPIPQSWHVSYTFLCINCIYLTKLAEIIFVINIYH